jgi:hypothetical protein
MLNIPLEVLLGDFKTLLANIKADQLEILETLQKLITTRIEELKNDKEDTGRTDGNTNVDNSEESTQGYQSQTCTSDTSGDLSCSGD